MDSYNSSASYLQTDLAERVVADLRSKGFNLLSVQKAQEMILNKSDRGEYYTVVRGGYLIFAKIHRCNHRIIDKTGYLKLDDS